MTPTEAAHHEVEVPLLNGDGSVRRMIKHKRPLTFLPLVALIFYEVSGGPFGTEDAVAAAGPLLVILGFTVFPLIWSVPEALITAELATAFPEDAGYVAWVTAAFGPFWGFQEGFWSWVAGVTDNSIYPVLFASYLEIAMPNLVTGWRRTLLCMAISIALAYLNYRGLMIVGKAAILMTVFLLVPFLILIGLSVPHIEPVHWLEVKWETVQWGPFINVMFWNLNYWDSVSTLAGEVAHPATVFPKALMTAVLLVVAMYLLPLLACLGVQPLDGQAWRLGYFATVAKQVGGHWLQWWIVAAAAVSAVGQFEAEMSSDSFQLLGMAERGFLPAILSHRSPHGTPTLAIILSSLGIVALIPFSFLEIVDLMNIVYCLAELVEFAAFVYLRYSAPNLHRPYQVPLPGWGCGLLLLPASAFLVTIIVMPIVARDWKVIWWTLGVAATGFVLFPLMQAARRSSWVSFSGACPYEYKERLRGLVPAPDPGSSDEDCLPQEGPFLPQ